jgi:hypothetical protein
MIDLGEDRFEYEAAAAKLDADGRRTRTMVPFLVPNAALVFLKRRSHQLDLFTIQPEAHVVRLLESLESNRRSKPFASNTVLRPATSLCNLDHTLRSGGDVALTRETAGCLP